MSSDYGAVMLDMDGLMLDTERIYYRAQREAAAQLGFDADDKLMISFVGLSVEECELRMRDAAGPGFQLEEYRTLWPRLWRDYVSQDGVPHKTGLTPLLDWLREDRIPCAVVTSTFEDDALLSLRAAGIDQHFDVVVSGDMVAQSKPAPDIYLLAAERLDVNPKKSVALEDSDAGVLAAVSAGMRAIMIPDLREPSEEARAAADAVLSTLTEALPLLKEWLQTRPSH